MKIKPVYFLILILMIMGFILVAKYKPEPSLNDSWVFKENQFGAIIGDLGGIPVSISKPFAHFVEYIDDPHFMVLRKGPSPKRTYLSKLRSFGFEVKFPEMVALTSATRKKYRQSTIHNTMWIDVGVKVASYHDEKSMERILDGTLEYTWGNGQYGYKQLIEPLYSLIVYQVYGYDDTKRDSDSGNSIMDSNIYHHVDEQGNIKNHIKCGNVRHDAVLCKHLFTLKGVKNTQISILYRKALLPQWRQIQTAVEKLILSFALAKQLPKT